MRSFRFTNSVWPSGIRANCENSDAIDDRLSICSIIVREVFSKRSLKSGSPLCSERSSSCTLSFIGVSGFLISCATCRAISRHAVSRSDLASRAALMLNSSSIRLYSFTSSAISSSPSYSTRWLLLPMSMLRIRS